MFVPREVLADVLAHAERSGPFVSDVARAPLAALEEVRYVPCPLCHATMNRANFGKVSGVIVDVCKEHGTWFDGGELTRVVAFAANGGLVKTRAREKQEEEQKARERVEAHREVAMRRAREQAEERLSEWRHFVDALLFW
jgi:Zn-finger nucleic acid-binding protein